MYKLKTGILSLIIIIFFGTTSQAVAAGGGGPSQLMLVLADQQALSQTTGGNNLAKSFMGLISTLKEGQFLAFASVDEPGDVLGPTLTGNTKFGSFLTHVDARLDSGSFDSETDWVKALTETYNFLSSEKALPGSTVYIISGGTSQSNLANQADHLKLVMDLFEETKWSIVGLSLPGSSPETQDFLTQISEESGGNSFELSATTGFKTLSDEILKEEAMGSLAQLGSGVLTPNQVITFSHSIAPGTHETTLLFFKENPYGSFRLINPSGVESASTDPTLSSVTETTNVVIWRIANPEPGQWRIDVRNVDGAVSAWHRTDNNYIPALESIGPIAINDPTTLIAYVRNGQKKIVLEDVTIVARVTSPEGMTLVHNLNDMGISGDSVAKDGYYSSNIPPVIIEGEYEVELELFWPKFDHRILSQDTFRAQPFPIIELTRLQTAELRPGERTKIATILVQVGGQPYAVSADQITSGMTSSVAEAGTIDIKPQRLVGEGRAWMYDVFFTPKERGLQTLIFYLNMEYVGKQYIHSSNHILLSSTLPIPPPNPVEAVKIPPVDTTTASKPQLQPIQPTIESSGFPWGLIIVPTVLILALVAVAIYWLSRTYPHGFLYNDRDELVVDFADLKRHPIMGLLFKNFVFGKELEAPGLEGVTFNFSGKRVSLRSRLPTPTVRVNNQPLVSETPIQHRTWLGTHGKLYSFLLSPREPLPQLNTGLADD